MYMGFMKMGLSLMSVFFFVILVSVSLNLNIVLFALPIIWFYSFFDCLNKMSMPEAFFADEQDRFLFSLDRLAGLCASIKYKTYIGIALVVAGGLILWENLWPEFSPYFVEEVRQAVSSVSHILPQVIVSVVIIFIGIRLISGKKKENSHV
jgi:hypothetical protein